MTNIAKLKPFDKIDIIRKCTGLSVTQKLILLVIATHLGKNEFCFLSFNTLQKECSLKKRTALSHNLKALIGGDILWKLDPNDKFNSNRYGINFQKVVTNGHHIGDLRLPDRSPRVTRLVTNGHPNRNLKEDLNEIKEELSSFQDHKKQKAEEAREEIRRKCRIKSKIQEKSTA